MERIGQFIRNLNEKKSFQVIFFIISMCIVFCGYFLIRERINKQITTCEDDFSWVYQVDEVETKGKEFILKGFAFNIHANARGNDYEIVLQELETGENYFLDMKYSDRKDVNDYFLCGNDYLHSGFEAKANGKEIDVYGKDYEVLLRIKGKKVAYRTEIFLNHGKLMYANPQEFVPLEVKGTVLEEIVHNGILRVYRPDYGMYVYQYGEELYWITEPNYDFIEGDIYVQCQLNTTQPKKLPKERLENGWDWDNIGFMFKTNELIDMNTGKYRVTKNKLPQEYSITYIWTGNFISDWIWRQNFRPFYILN